MIWGTLSWLIASFTAIYLCLIRQFSWIMASALHWFSSHKWVLICAHPRHSSHLHNSFWHAGSTCRHCSYPYNDRHKLLSHAYEFQLARNLLVSKTHITDRCSIQKSAEALITNEHYCLWASNTELKLSTTILYCIDYRTHVQMLLSSHCYWHHSVGDLTYQSTYI
jgi:hypothetical protein